MAEHRIPKNGIIYIIPNDELFEKWENDEAFIDDYGRLMNRKPHRVLKELKHYPMTQQRTVAPSPAPVRNGSSVVDYLKEAALNSAVNAGKYLIDRAVNIFYYEALPNVWKEHIVPFCHLAKEALTSNELKAESVLQNAKMDDEADAKPKVVTKMTQQEADAEKRKVLYHWLGMLSSLKKLQDAGELDADTTLSRLTDPAELERVNGFLSDNPNLLEVDKYIMLHSLLGRDLYEKDQLIPIKAPEITAIAATYGYKAKTKKTEDVRNG